MLQLASGDSVVCHVRPCVGGRKTLVACAAAVGKATGGVRWIKLNNARVTWFRYATGCLANMCAKPRNSRCRGSSKCSAAAAHVNLPADIYLLIRCLPEARGLLLAQPLQLACENVQGCKLDLAG